MVSESASTTEPLSVRRHGICSQLRNTRRLFGHILTRSVPGAACWVRSRRRCKLPSPSTASASSQKAEAQASGGSSRTYRSPPGLSVNDGIDPDLCSLTYTSVERVAEVVAVFPPEALLAKIDIELAYRLTPVHPRDRPLQAVQWGGALYIDPMLPFGLRSTPKMFNAFADGLEWYLRWLGIRNIFHYLDDFLVVGPPMSSECAVALATLNQACAQLGIHIAEHKHEGPTSCLTFLGIEVDTVVGQLRLPANKLVWLQSLLRALSALQNFRQHVHVVVFEIHWQIAST